MFDAAADSSSAPVISPDTPRLPPNGVTPSTALGRFFFRSGSTQRLAVVRIVCVAAQLLLFSYPLSSHQQLLASPGFDDPQWITSVFATLIGGDNLRSPAFWSGLCLAVQAAGVMALVGLCTAPALFVFATGTSVAVAHVYSYGEYHHPQGIFTLLLLLLAFVPSGDCLSLDALRRRRGRAGRAWWAGTVRPGVVWPLLATQVLMVMAYLDAGLSKLIVGGIPWFNGYTLQNYLLTDGIRFDKPLGVWLAHYRWACVALAVGAVSLELTFFVTLVRRLRRLWPLWLVGGFMMHLSIYLLQGATFFPFMVLYILWLPVGERGQAKA